MRKCRDKPRETNLLFIFLFVHTLSHCQDGRRRLEAFLIGNNRKKKVYYKKEKKEIQ